MSGKPKRPLLEEIFVNSGMNPQHAQLLNSAVQTGVNKVSAKVGIHLGPKPQWMKTLGLGRRSTHEDAKKVWRNIQKTHHPDKGGDDETFKRLKDAWEEAKAYYKGCEEAEKKAAKKKAYKAKTRAARAKQKAQSEAEARAAKQRERDLRRAARNS